MPPLKETLHTVDWDIFARKNICIISFSLLRLTGSVASLFDVLIIFTVIGY